MPKRLDRFGGWLRIFQLFLYFNIVVTLFAALSVLIVLFSIVESPEAFEGMSAWQERLLMATTLMTCCVSLYFPVKMLWFLKKRLPEIPSKVVFFFFWWTAVMLAIGIVDDVVVSLSGLSDFISSESSSGGERKRIQAVFREVMSYMICAYYFSKSSRVFAYYGSNADRFY